MGGPPHRHDLTHQDDTLRAADCRGTLRDRPQSALRGKLVPVDRVRRLVGPSLDAARRVDHLRRAGTARLRDGKAHSSAASTRMRTTTTRDTSGRGCPRWPPHAAAAAGPLHPWSAVFFSERGTLLAAGVMAVLLIVKHRFFA